MQRPGCSRHSSGRCHVRSLCDHSCIAIEYEICKNVGVTTHGKLIDTKIASHRYIYFFELLPYITSQILVIHQLELIYH